MNLQFLIKYGELESVEPEYWAEGLGVSSTGASGSGVVLIVTSSSILFSFFFLVFHGVGGVGGKFSISK